MIIIFFTGLYNTKRFLYAPRIHGYIIILAKTIGISFPNVIILRRPCIQFFLSKNINKIIHRMSVHAFIYILKTSLSILNIILPEYV